MKKRENINTLILSDMEITDEPVNVICQLEWLEALYLPFNELFRKIAQELDNLEELDLNGNSEINDITPCKKMKN